MQPTDDTRRGSGARGSIRRRGFLAAGASATTVALAGCASVLDFIGGLVLDDVTVVNGADQDVAGSVEVADPNGEPVLEERFEGDEDGEDEDPEPVAPFGDVLTDAGEYAVSVELDEDDAIDGETAAEATLDVEDTEDEHVIVFLDPDGEGAIAIDTVEEFSDLEQFDDEFDA